MRVMDCEGWIRLAGVKRQEAKGETKKSSARGGGRVGVGALKGGLQCGTNSG